MTKEIKESFASLFKGEKKSVVGSVIKGTIIHIDSENALVDVGLKSEGRIPLNEFSIEGKADVAIGDSIDVYVTRMENRDGEIVLSRERAKHEEVWQKLEKFFLEKKHVEGGVTGRVRGGLTVDIMGIASFLPGSQVDVRPMRNTEDLINSKQTFKILKMDRARGNIVVSRRAVLEESSLKAREKILETLFEGKVVEGVIKNIADYGAFVDLGGVDGLLHVTDIAWKRVNHPSEALSVGDTIKVKIIRFNKESNRISLGIKQMMEDPWKTVTEKYIPGKILKGIITNITEYGAFVELEDGVEGLIHISEISWTKKNIHPGKIVSTSQAIDVKVIGVDVEKRRISLSIKQCQENPWDKIMTQYPVDTVVDGQIKNITDFGMFVGIAEDIDGMIHASDISWQYGGEKALSKYKKGEAVKAIVLGIDREKERISLGIKQLSEDPAKIAKDALKSYQKGDIVTVIISNIREAGLDVMVGDKSLSGFIKRSELSIDKSEQRTDRFAAKEKVDAQIISISQKDMRLNLSIKALETAQEKKSLAKYGSVDSGATLGDILNKTVSVLKTDKKQ